MEETLHNFHKACKDNNNLILVQEFIETGTDVNSRENPLRNTALLIATEHRCYDIVKYLLSVQANRSLANIHGLLPLHLALLNSDLPMVKLLCNFKTINVLIHSNKDDFSGSRFPDGYTAVHIAATLCNVDILTHICKYNPNFFQKDFANQTPLDIVLDDMCETRKSPDVIGTILGNSDVFHEAVSKGYTGVVRRLLQGGADVNSFNKKQETALYVAVENNRLESVKELIAHDGCDLDVKINHSSYVRRYQQGLTALHLACLRMQVDTVETLVRAGASTNTKDAFWDTPLSTVCKLYWRHTAPGVRHKVKVITEHLLKHDAMVNISVGTSPLLEIAMGCNLNTVVNELNIMLLSAGAYVQPVNEKFEVYDRVIEEHLLSLPPATILFLFKCGVKFKHQISTSTSDLPFLENVLVSPPKLLDICVIRTRKLLQLNCHNIWSGEKLLDFPLGFNVELLGLNWKECGHIGH